MNMLQRMAKGGFLLGLMVMATGCIVAEPREGFYDRDHHRYYREHSWHECAGHDEFCR